MVEEIRWLLYFRGEIRVGAYKAVICISRRGSG
jgi:hypothetical protein